MKDNNWSLFRLGILFVAFCAGLLINVHAFAGESGWGDMPERLKQDEGTAYQGNFLYATGVARASVSVRPDKTHDVARRKSLLRAIQLIRMASSCRELASNLDESEHQEFIKLFSPLAPGFRIEGITIVRQWEKKGSHFTTVAVPVASLGHIPCSFSDLSEIVSGYLKSGHVSQDGLIFSLRHTPRYSRLNREILKRAGVWYQERGLRVQARCFLNDKAPDAGGQPLKTFILQNSIMRAGQLTGQAEAKAVKGRWDKAMDYASQALDIMPTYSRTYLLLSDYFLKELKNPAFALEAAQKALQDGTYLKEALKRIVFCLEELDSPEKEVFQFLLSRSEKGGDKAFQSPWNEDIAMLADARVPYLVLLSLGQAVEGESDPPGPEYGQAVALFNKANNDEDVMQVLVLLFSACEKHPYSEKTYNLIGACFRLLGKPDLALPFLWQALTLRPEYDYALTNLGLCCQKLGLMQSARFYFEHEAVANSKSDWVKGCYTKFHETNN